MSDLDTQRPTPREEHMMQEFENRLRENEWAARLENIKKHHDSGVTLVKLAAFVAGAIGTILFFRKKHPTMFAGLEKEDPIVKTAKEFGMEI